MVTNEQRLSSFLYLLGNDFAPNVDIKEFNDWLITIVLNKRFFSFWPLLNHFHRIDLFHRLLTSGVYRGISVEETPFAFVYSCHENDIEIEDLINTWDTLMLLYCFVYKKVDYIF
jgi:hypothetical protein